MKVAIITSSFYPVIDGVTVAVFNRVKQLSKLGHQVIIFCPDYSVIQHIYPNWQDYTGNILPGVTVINLPSKPSISLEFERDVTSKSYKIVNQQLSDFKPDIIHVDEAERLTICFLQKPGIKFAQENNIPCVTFFHTNYLEYVDDYFQLPLGLKQIVKASLSFFFSQIYNSYDLTLVSSKNTYQKLAKRSLKNLKYAELLGLDLETFSLMTKESDFFAKYYRINNLENKIKLIFIGRLTPDKGWDFGLKALAKFSPEILTKIAFIVIGDGELKNSIKTNLSFLTPHVYLLGRVAPNLIPQILKNCDIFVTNSEKETRGLAVLEACAAEIPAIAPRAGGIIDTIIDGENGFLYQPGNSAEFISKLTQLILDSSLRHIMGQKAQTTIQTLSWQQTTNNLIQIWQEQINNVSSN